MEQKRAIITGASKGIGRAIAFKLAYEGYSLALCARTLADLNLLKMELEVYKTEILVFQVDCSIKAEIMEFIKQVDQHWGGVEVLINNVGYYKSNLILEEDDLDFEYHLAVNLLAPYYLSKHYGNLMKKKGSGHIFNIISISAIEQTVNYGSYGVTKAGLLSLNNVINKELAEFGVKVTAILPGPTLTHSWAGTNIPSDRFLDPKDIAENLYQVLKLGSNTQVDEIIIKPLQFKI